MLYVFEPFWYLLTKGGEAYEFDSLQAGPYGWLLYFCYICQVLTTLVFDTFGSF